jgi:outer membrane protein assembly factor BamC
MNPRHTDHLLPTWAVLAGAFALALAGCSNLGKTSSEGPRYEASRQIDTLEVPPDLIGPGMDRAYRIPEAPGERVSARELERDLRAAPRPGAGRLAVLPDSPEVQLRRDGQIRWLNVKASPEDLWPQLRDFWRTQNLVLVRDEPTLGIMETEWSENRAGIPLGVTRGFLSRLVGTIYDAGTRDQYRLRVERINGTTDVFISHRGAVEEGVVDAQASRWFIREPDPALEAEMLNRLLVFLTTGQVASASVPVEEADFERTGQVDLVERDGRPVLLVWGEPDALWRRLGLALDRTGLLVDEQNRRSGTFLVTYRPSVTEQGQKSGVFSRIFGTGPRTRGREGQRFQVLMIENGRELQIVALTVEGQPLPARDARFVLELIQPQLR